LVELEYNMAKDKTITIDFDNFKRGIGDSPIVGNGFLKHCNLNNDVGGIGASGATTATTITPTDDIMQIRRNPENNNIYSIDKDNNIYSLSGSTWTKITPGTGTPSSGTSLDMAIWKNMIFVFLSNKIDIYDIAADKVYPDWESGTFTFDVGTSGFVPNIIGSDDRLYFATDNEVNYVQEDTTFDPNSGATYTATDGALDLPSRYKIKTLEEYNNNLAMGTWVGANLGTIKVADLFFWDFVSTSFDGPLKFNEAGINQMINANGLLYVVAGITHTLYVTDGTRIEKIKDMHILKDYDTPIMAPKPNAIMFHKGKIYTGTGRGTATTEDYRRPMGIYSIDIENGNVLAFENTISTGRSNGGIDITALLSTGRNSFLAGWTDTQEATDWGIDEQDDTNPYSDNSVEYESQLFPVGEKRRKRTFNSIEFELLNNTTDSTQGVTLYYREHPEDAYVIIGSKKTDLDDGPFDSWTFDFAPTLSNIQIKAVIDEATTISGDDLLILKRIIIK